MGAPIRSGVVLTAFVAVWASLLLDFINWLRAPPIDWAIVVGQIARVVLWACLLAALYAIYCGWSWLISQLRRWVTSLRQGCRRGA